ncbi:MAG: hypothetical protein HC806_05695 [Anaerolineae bacterium]|nr:hypothetical protein [Anaerolineae bacterium]
MFAGDAAGDWALFEAQFLEASGLFTLSQVGFNSEGTQALVYLGRMVENDNGHFYHLLSYHNGIWVNNAAFRLPSP